MTGRPVGERTERRGHRPRDPGALLTVLREPVPRLLGILAGAALLFLLLLALAAGGPYVPGMVLATAVAGGLMLLAARQTMWRPLSSLYLHERGFAYFAVLDGWRFVDWLEVSAIEHLEFEDYRAVYVHVRLPKRCGERARRITLALPLTYGLSARALAETLRDGRRAALGGILH